MRTTDFKNDVEGPLPKASSLREKASAVVHCTGGDIFIAVTVLLLATAMVTHSAWPARSDAQVLAVTVALGVGYTIIQRMTEHRRSRKLGISAWMPAVPVVSTGLSPPLQ